MIYTSRKLLSNNFCKTLLILNAYLFVLPPTTALADSSSVTNLGTLGGDSYAYGVSADGTVVVGQFLPSASAAFRWTQSGGMVYLGTLGGANSSYALGTSADGSVVVGNADIAGDSTYHAYRWTQSGGMVDLGTLSAGIWSTASGVSSDGSVVVGTSAVNGESAYYAFRWTQSGGMVDLGSLGGNSSANGVSADGSVVVGYSYLTGNTVQHAFRWTQSGGFTDLGTLGGTYSVAAGVSADGNVVVGNSTLLGDSSSRAFRWTQSSGMSNLGTLGGSVSYAWAVSGNGDIVVGYSLTSGNSSQHAFRWTQATGMQDLNTILSNSGVNMSNITLTTAYAISPNGQYIAGVGQFSGLTRAFLSSYDYLFTTTNEETSTQALSDCQRSMLIQSRSTANELLGGTRPVDQTNYTYVGGMFGSAVGFTGGQYSTNNITLLGGIAYGAQDYSNIKQDAAPTLAAAVRYIFEDPFGDEAKNIHPYVEVGSWVTPQANLTLSRNYENGSGTSTGEGTTEATSWAEYGRLGITSDISEIDRLTGFSELGQQYMSFSGYNEFASISNPFPATVSNGTLRMDVVRTGGIWTHKFDAIQLTDDYILPVSITLDGNIAHSFYVNSGLTTTVGGLGASTAANTTDTWGEFGGRVESKIYDNVALDLEINGTTGGDQIGTTLHGGIGLTYNF